MKIRLKRWGRYHFLKAGKGSQEFTFGALAQFEKSIWGSNSQHISNCWKETNTVGCAYSKDLGELSCCWCKFFCNKQAFLWIRTTSRLLFLSIQSAEGLWVLWFWLLAGGWLNALLSVYIFLWGICPLADCDKTRQLFAQVWHFSAAAGYFPACSHLSRLCHSMPESTAVKTGSGKSVMRRHICKVITYHICLVLQHPESCNLCHQQLVWSLT